jgi:hypothetical protein
VNLNDEFERELERFKEVRPDGKHVGVDAWRYLAQLVEKDLKGMLPWDVMAWQYNLLNWLRSGRRLQEFPVHESHVRFTEVREESRMSTRVTTSLSVLKDVYVSDIERVTTRDEFVDYAKRRSVNELLRYLSQPRPEEKKPDQP